MHGPTNVKIKPVCSEIYSTSNHQQRALTYICAWGTFVYVEYPVKSFHLEIQKLL